MGRAWVWLAPWFVCNLLITLGSKGVFRTYGFRFPRTLTLVHMLFTSVLSNAAAFAGISGDERARPIPRTARMTVHVLGYSILFTCNIVLSNIALQFVSVSMHQVIRSLTPAFTALLGLPLGYRIPLARALALLPLALGVSIAVLDADAHTSADGVVLTLLSAAVSAAKGILTKTFLVDPQQPISPLGLVRLASPLAFAYMLPLAIWSEGAAVRRFFGNRAVRADGYGMWSLGAAMSDPLLLLLAASGAGAFFLNALSFFASKHTEPVTMAVVASVKQVLTIALGAWLFGVPLKAVNCGGIALALCSALAYSLGGARSHASLRRGTVTKPPLSPPTRCSTN